MAIPESRKPNLSICNVGHFLFRDSNCFQDANVLELVGDEASGKSTVLQQLLMDCILPKSHGGSEASAVYFDLDGHLDLLRILSAIEQRTEADENVIKTWLKRLYIIRCDSTEQLVITLHSIEPLIANSKTPFGMIIIDSLTAFYWMDCLQGGDSQYLKEIKLRKVVSVLKTFRERYKVSVLAATQQLVNPVDKFTSNTEKQCLHKSFLGSYWNEFVNYRFVLKSDRSIYHPSKEITAYCVNPSSYEKRFVIDERGLSEI